MMRLGFTRIRVTAQPDRGPLAYSTQMLTMAGDWLDIELPEGEFIASVYLTDDTGLPLAQIPMTPDSGEWYMRSGPQKLGERCPLCRNGAAPVDDEHQGDELAGVDEHQGAAAAECCTRCGASSEHWRPQHRPSV